MTIERRRAGTRASLLAGSIALAMSFAALAQSLTFDIAAGDLKAALDAYAKQTGRQLVYQPGDIKGRTTAGVHGAMSAEAALAALLEGTGLKVNRDASGAVAIFSAEAVAGDASTQTAGTERTTDEVVVTSTRVSQINTTSRSATRVDTDPMKLPMSISAVQGDLLLQQQARSLTDLLNNVAGVDVSGINGISMRGFDASLARNGTIENGTFAYLINQRPLVAVDRVEVVKGPEQIMQGAGGGIGGMVNVITKIPEAQPIAQFGAAGGSEGFWRIDADVNDTLFAKDGHRLMGRLIGSTSGAGRTDVGYDGATADFGSAGLRWENADWGAKLGVVYEYNATSTPSAPEVVTMGDSFRAGMQEYAFGADDAYFAARENAVDMTFSQRLWEDWTLGISYQWDETERRVRSTTTTGVLPPATVRAFSGVGPGWDLSARSNDVKVDIRGRVLTGPLEHKLMLAYDDHGSQDSRAAGTIRQGFYFTDLDTGVKTFVSAPRSAPAFRGKYDETGLLFVNQMNWGAWSALVGVRRISFESETVSVGFGDPSRSTGDATLPQYGLVYRVMPDVSLYASGGKGFRSNDGLLDFTGKQLPNETSTQYELGLKALLFDRRVAVTLAAYRIHQVNVQTLDPDPNNIPVSGDLAFIAIPGLTSKGVELEVSGEPVRGLQMRANFTYTQQEFDDGAAPFLGYVPKSLNLWTQYWFGRDAGRGWWGGVGVAAKEAPESSSGAPRVPGYTTVDLQAGYASRHWSATAGFKNVADLQTFYPTAQFTEFATVQPGSSYQVDLTYRF